jgi:hypothetical protein
MERHVGGRKLTKKPKTIFLHCSERQSLLIAGTTGQYEHSGQNEDDFTF